MVECFAGLLYGGLSWAPGMEQDETLLQEGQPCKLFVGALLPQVRLAVVPRSPTPTNL